MQRFVKRDNNTMSVIEKANSEDTKSKGFFRIKFFKAMSKCSVQEVSETSSEIEAPPKVTTFDKRDNSSELQPTSNHGDVQDVNGTPSGYQCDKNSQINLQAGSTVPLVEISGSNVVVDEDYNPFEHRKLAHPTSDLDTFIHLLKGSLGSGILAMPLAFLNAGLFFGLFATFTVGCICTYCVHILVKTAHELCHRIQVPSLGFAETAEAAFLAGPAAVHKFSRLAKAMVNTFLVIDLLGCCCVYIVFVSRNIKQVVDYYTNGGWDVRAYMAMLAPFLLAMNMIKNLKHLSPLSMIANILIGTGIAITFYYILTDLPSVDTRPNFADWHQLPLFFGTAIFALEGIGVVMPLENNMKTPTHFIGCPGVLNMGMFLVVSLYSLTGFFGYLKYGNATEGSITLNLPDDDILAQSVKVMIAIAIFLTYSLQFYVPMDIIWRNIGHRFGARKNIAENMIRSTIVIGTVFIAIAIPDLGPFISLVGAVCLSTLGLMFPAILELVTFWERPAGSFHLMLVKNLLLISFGMLGFVTGTYVSIQEIINDNM